MMMMMMMKVVVVMMISPFPTAKAEVKNCLGPSNICEYEDLQNVWNFNSIAGLFKMRAV